MNYEDLTPCLRSGSGFVGRCLSRLKTYGRRFRCEASRFPLGLTQRDQQLQATHEIIIAQRALRPACPGGSNDLSAATASPGAEGTQRNL